MSGRIRSLKPEWLTDEKLGRLSDAARVLSAGLILVADDHGRDRGSVAILASEVWPYHMEREPRETLAKASRAVQELAGIGYMRLYEVRGERYFAITNWTRHQRVDKPGKPRVPSPREDVASDSRDSREDVANVSRLISDLRPPITDPDLYQPSVGSRRKAKTPSPAPPELSAFAAWVQREWPDVREPWAWEPRLREAYPAVDLLVEARRALEWEESHHRKKRHQAFFVRWLNRGNDKGTFARDNAARTTAAARPAIYEPARERTQDELDALARESLALASRSRT